MLLDFKFKVDKNNKPSDITFEGLIRAQIDKGVVRYWEFLEEGEWTDFKTVLKDSKKIQHKEK